MEKETFIFNRKEIIEQLKQVNPEALFHQTDSVRRAFCGEEIHIRGIIEFSNYCCRSCLYCGLREENKNIKRYRLSPEKIIKLSDEIIQCGIKTVVLQSGDDFGYSQKTLSDIIHKIKNKHPGIAITLSIGERPLADYKAFKKAGADRYLLKHETANPALYKRLHPGQTLKKRIEILKELKKLDFQVGAGNIVGLPGQTIADLADDILLMNELDVDMAGIGPFIAQKDTAWSGFSSPSLELTLRVLALSRITAKNIHLPAVTALASLAPEEGQLSALKAGGNVIMPDFTPESCRKNYAIYDNKAKVSLERAKKLILKAGRLISKTRGDSLKCKKHLRDYVCT